MDAYRVTLVNAKTGSCMERVVEAPNAYQAVENLIRARENPRLWKACVPPRKEGYSWKTFLSS